MPHLIQLYLRSILTGAVLGLVFAVCLIGLDIAGLRHLLTGSAAGLIGLFMLVFFHAALFAGVQFGAAVMLMAASEGGPPRRPLLADRARLPIILQSQKVRR